MKPVFYTSRRKNASLFGWNWYVAAQASTPAKGKTNTIRIILVH
jgi:hypothetical protein